METQLIAPVKFWHQRRVREAIEIKAHNTVPQDIGFFINDILSPLLKPTLPAAAHHNTDTLQRTHIQTATNSHASPDKNSFDPSRPKVHPSSHTYAPPPPVVQHSPEDEQSTLFETSRPNRLVPASLLLIFLKVTLIIHTMQSFKYVLFEGQKTQCLQIYTKLTQFEDNDRKLPWKYYLLRCCSFWERGNFSLKIIKFMHSIASRVFFLHVTSCNFDVKLSPHFHRFVIFCTLCWDTPSQNIVNTKTSSACIQLCLLINKGKVFPLIQLRLRDGSIIYTFFVLRKQIQNLSAGYFETYSYWLQSYLRGGAKM